MEGGDGMWANEHVHLVISVDLYLPSSFQLSLSLSALCTVLFISFFRLTCRDTISLANAHKCKKNLKRKIRC